MLSEHHRLCSLHFKQGRKMGCIDVYVLFPLLPKPLFSKTPKKRSSQVPTSTKMTTTSEPVHKSSCENQGNNTETDAQTTETLVKELQEEISELKSKFEALTVDKFGLDRFAG